MIVRKLKDKKPKILIFQGSPRKKNSCANQIPKSEKLVKYIVEKWLPFADFDVIDLGVGDVIIQPCKGCVSTSDGMHCHYYCTCYKKGSSKAPDLMYEADIYKKLEECDGFLVISPIHWYSVTTQVKAMFDRLVCANLTITKDQAIEIFGKGNIKNSKLTGKAELSKEYKHLLKNHLEGKWASFIAHGDNGADEYNNENAPDIGDKNWDIKNTLLPLVYQCRYSGMHCPDDLIEAVYINEGMEYYKANFQPLDTLFEISDNIIEKLIDYIENFNLSL